MADYPRHFDKDDLLKCARGELFGPGNAQLPEPPMLMMDRITDISADGGAHGKGHVVAEFDIHPDLWFFECHFPGNPIMPGCLGLVARALAETDGDPPRAHLPQPDGPQRHRVAGAFLGRVELEVVHADDPLAGHSHQALGLGVGVHQQPGPGRSGGDEVTEVADEEGGEPGEVGQNWCRRADCAST